MTSQTEARKHINRLASIVQRAETGQLTGRNWKATNGGAAYGNLKRALRAVVAIEDAEGIAAAAALSDRLTDLRQRAQRQGLVTSMEVAAAETFAIEMQS